MNGALDGLAGTCGPQLEHHTCTTHSKQCKVKTCQWYHENKRTTHSTVTKKEM